MESLKKWLNYRKHFAGEQKHSFHIVTRSPWPFLSGMTSLFLTSSAVMYFHSYKYGGILLICAFILLVSIMALWWRDVIREATYLGYHTTKVVKGLRYGMVLFIISEVMFFFSFFWAFFHSSLAPATILGCVWPPIGINVLDPFHIPLLNTFILVVSGVTITLSHYSICSDAFVTTFYSLLITILLGIEFTCWQAVEYYEALSDITDGVYGSTFYMTTGFHGLHVLIGTTFLIVCFYRLIKGHFVRYHHFGFEAAIWYWHFVDVVWLLLYLSIYCWGSGIII
jgi:cytochrome c oxidase subunit 3